MPLTRVITDAFGVITISLVSLTAVFGLICICRSLYFQVLVKKRGYLQLNYFTGPWITRIALVLVTVWWGIGEIVRLTFLRERIKFLPMLKFQNVGCKFYILSNLGFAEPCMCLMLAFLLHAALQKRESGTLSQQWNRRTIGCVLLISLQLFVMQLALVLFGPKLNNHEENGKRTKMMKFFANTYSSAKGNSICTYPLMSTAVFGLFVTLLISYVSYVGARLVRLVINKGLRRRVYLLIFSTVLFLALRVLLLGFSVLPHPGNLSYEIVVFIAFNLQLFCAVVGISMLVYFPVEDSLALKDRELVEMEEMPYDDYYSEGACLIANHSNLETGRNSDASTKRGSISFRTIIRDDTAV